MEQAASFDPPTGVEHVSPPESHLFLQRDPNDHEIILVDDELSEHEEHNSPSSDIHDDLDTSPFDPPDQKHTVALSPDRDSKRLRLESEELTLVDKDSLPQDIHSSSLDVSFTSESPVFHPLSPARQKTPPVEKHPEPLKDVEFESLAVTRLPITAIPDPSLENPQKDSLSEKVYYAQIMDIIKSGQGLMDALDILLEIKYLGLSCPMDLCWLLIQEGGFRRDPGIIHGVFLHLASFEIPLSPNEYAMVLLQLIHSSSTSHFQATLSHFMTIYGSILNLNVVALWKAAYALASTEILQTLLSVYCTIQNPSNIDHALLNMMMSHLVELNLTLDVLKLMDKIQDWKSLALVLDQTCLLQLGNALMTMKECERVFKVVQLLTLSRVHDLAMKLFQAIYHRVRFETLTEEVFEWIVGSLELSLRDECVMEKYLDHLIAQRNFEQCIDAYTLLASRNFSFSEPTLNHLLDLSKDFCQTKTCLQFISASLGKNRSILSSLFITRLMETAFVKGYEEILTDLKSYADQNHVYISRKPNPKENTREDRFMPNDENGPRRSMSPQLMTAMEEVRGQDSECTRVGEEAQPVLESDQPNSLENIQSQENKSDGQLQDLPSHSANSTSTNVDSKLLDRYRTELSSHIQNERWTDFFPLIFKIVDILAQIETKAPIHECVDWIDAMINAAPRDKAPLLHVYGHLKAHMTCPLSEDAFYYVFNAYLSMQRFTDAIILIKDMRRLDLVVDRNRIRKLSNRLEDDIYQSYPFGLTLQLFLLCCQGSAVRKGLIMHSIPLTPLQKYGRVPTEYGWCFTHWKLAIMRALYWMKTQISVDDWYRVPAMIIFGVPSQLVARDHRKIIDPMEICDLTSEWLATKLQPPLLVQKRECQDKFSVLWVQKSNVEAWMSNSHQTLVDIFPESVSSDWEDVSILNTDPPRAALYAPIEPTYRGDRTRWSYTSRHMSQNTMRRNEYDHSRQTVEQRGTSLFRTIGFDD